MYNHMVFLLYISTFIIRFQGGICPKHLAIIIVISQIPPRKWLVEQFFDHINLTLLQKTWIILKNCKILSVLINLNIYLKL